VRALRTTLVVLSALLLGAHFLRAGQIVLAGASVLAPLLLAVRRPWAPVVLRVLLLLAAAEWGRTAVVLIRRRAAGGESWTRLAIVLGAVVVLTAGAALAVRGRPADVALPPPA